MRLIMPKWKFLTFLWTCLCTFFIKAPLKVPFYMGVYAPHTAVDSSVTVHFNNRIPETVLLAWQPTLLTTTLDIMRSWHRRTSIQQNLEDLIIIFMGRQYQRSYVRCISRSNWINSFPWMGRVLNPNSLLMFQKKFHTLSIEIVVISGGHNYSYETKPSLQE